MEEITKKARQKLDVSKLEDKEFRFTRIYIKKVVESIDNSINDYVKSSEMFEVRDGRPHEALTRE